MYSKCKKTFKKIFWWMGLMLCIMLIPIIVINTTLIVKSYKNPKIVPDFLGYKPFIVLSGSMEPYISAGDMIITKNSLPQEVKSGDVIAYRVNGGTVVTHRVVEVEKKDKIVFSTKGDNNNSTDIAAVNQNQLEGRFVYKIRGLGNFAMFLQTPMGLLVFIVFPIALYILYDVISKLIVKKRMEYKKIEN